MSYYKANRDTILEKARRYYAEHREQILAIKAANYVRRPRPQKPLCQCGAPSRCSGKCKSCAQKEYYKINKVAILAQQKGTTPEKRMAFRLAQQIRNRRYRAKPNNKTKAAMRSKRFQAACRKNLPDAYIRNRLKFYHSIPNPTHEQIEQHRAIIQAKRSSGFFRAIAGASAITG